ncbi:RNA polymerase II transcription elongation factor-domain-containing protein [Russula brevipes]|nr:RNA polymerase II transcription elongation factor-domain-containing protein [Russula brevipes]
MATASSSWMPTAGRHNVSIGSSLSKALKARKGQPPQRSKALPERDFYALRYNHKPASIDPTKPGTLEANPGREVTTVRVERPAANSNEVNVFKGDEKPAKEWECVLIFDEATQTFTLEKLDSLVNLNFDGKALPRTRPGCVPASSSAVQTPQRSPVRTAADELEALLEDTGTGLGADPDADAEGEPDPSFFAPKEEEEEEEEEMAGVAGVAARAAPPPPPPAAQSTTSKARPTSSKKSASAPTSTPHSTKAARMSAAAPAPAPSSKPRPRPVPPAPPTASAPSTALPSAKRAALEHRDVEDFEIRGPIAPASAARRASTATTTTMTASPAPPPSAQGFSLALPTASAGPDPLAHQGLYHGHGGGAAAGGGATAPAMESEDEWDEILGHSDNHPTPGHASHPQQQQQQQITITLEEEADDDGLDFLERELLGEDEPMADGDRDGDGDGDVDGDGDGDGGYGDEDEDLEEEIIHASSRVGAGAGPMSMTQFAGGDVAVDDEDDDYSSSEESED